FESGTQGWVPSGGMITGVSSSTAQASAGRHSLAVNINGAAGTQDVHIANPIVPAGSTVTFHVWCPAGSPVSSVQPYALQGAAGGDAGAADTSATDTSVAGASTRDTSAADTSVPDASAPDTSAPDSSTGVDAGATTSGYPAGWVYTKGNKIYVSNGSSGGSAW